MSNARSASLTLWSLLLVVPLVFFATFLAPGLGDYGEGLWPEFYADAQKGTESFGEIAKSVRIWSFCTLLLELVAAVGVYVWTIQSWRSKLRTFDIAQVGHYTRFVWARIGMTYALAVVLAIFTLVISVPLWLESGADPPRYVIFVTAVGLFGVLQFLMLTFGFKATRTLYRGK